MLTLGGVAAVALAWVLYRAVTSGVGWVGVFVAVAALGILGYADNIADGTSTLITSVTPTLNSVGSGGSAG